jgi:hypothetical protein
VARLRLRNGLNCFERRACGIKADGLGIAARWLLLAPKAFQSRCTRDWDVARPAAGHFGVA